MENTTAEDWAADCDELSDLVAAAEDLRAFLNGLACLAARVVSHAAGTRVECSVTLGRRKRPETIGGTTDTAIVVDRIGQTLGEGPYVDALVSGHPVLLDDVLTSPRWGDYCTAVTAAGMRGTLAIHWYWKMAVLLG